MTPPRTAGWEVLPAAPPTTVVEARLPDPAPAPTGLPARPSWVEWAPLVAVTGLALVLNCWALSGNGLGNTYYAAATRSMTRSWHNFFFASFDPGGFISVDKPPVAVWASALSARIFGWSSWSLLLPSALAGAASVALLFRIVRRRFGVVAGTVAGLVLALSPINVAVNRLNLPEPFMVLFLLGMVWAVERALDDRAHAVRWLVIAGAFGGLAFNTKMLAAAIAWPAIGVAVLIGTRGDWRRRLRSGLVLAGATVACSLPWMVLVDLWPRGSRPYVGGSTNDTVRDLVFGYNGFGRVDGNGQGGPRGGGFLGGPGGVFGGAPGKWRLFGAEVGPQIAWLLPLAVVGALVAAWCWRRSSRRLASVALWAGWLALYGVVFSFAKGTFHSYYTSAMAPAVGALVGIGAAGVLRLARRSFVWIGAAAVGIASTVWLSLVLSDRVPAFYGWTRGVGVAMVLLGAGVVALRLRWSLRAGLAIALAGVLVAPAAWAVSEAANPTLNATLPQAGPRSGVSARTFGSADARFAGDPVLAAWLKARRTPGQRWDLVVVNAQSASALIASDDLSVMALGGFLGIDPAATVASTADRIAAGQVRWFEAGGGFGGFGGFGPVPPFGGRFGRRGPGRFPFNPPPGFGPRFGARGTAQQIMAAVAQACRPVTAPSSSGSTTLYDCAGQADAVRAAGG